MAMPPDAVLYTGKRDSAVPGAPPPKGVITPGAVRYVSFAGVNGSSPGRASAGPSRGGNSAPAAHSRPESARAESN